MKLIIHGNDLQKSRDFFFQERNNAKSFVLLNGDKLLFDDFYSKAEGNSLFEPDKTILIENLFTANKSTSLEFKKIVEYINSTKKLDIIFWESTELSKTSQNLIKDVSIKTFSIPSQLFIFLDSLKPGNYKSSILIFESLSKMMEKELIFFMLVRQFRLLLAVLDANLEIDEAKRIAPWQMSKLKSQAKTIGQDKLIKSYKQLFEIENNHKTGKVPYEISKSIDFFLAQF